MATTVFVTRKSKVGYGYTTELKNDGTGELETPMYPIHRGTIKQVEEKIQNDLTLQSLRNNVSYSWCWFVKVGNNWKRIKRDQFNHVRELLEKLPEGVYLYDLLELEIEQ